MVAVGCPRLNQKEPESSHEAWAYSEQETENGPRSAPVEDTECKWFVIARHLKKKIVPYV